MSWPGITMFLLFFGIATMDAFTSGNWLRIVFWVAMGIVFAMLDWWGQRRRVRTP
jgi:membrane protein implicated in regulation of membrane protease activity